MVRTSSTMLALGTILPPFSLNIVQGTNLKGSYENDIRIIDSKRFDQKPLLLMLICAHCPFVKNIETQITELEKDFGDLIDMIAISSNSLITHPEDSPDDLAEQANRNGWGFPYLFDQDQSLAKSLKAACTPDFFLFSPIVNGEQQLSYRGRLDGSSPGNDQSVTGEDLRLALNAILKRRLPNENQKPSIGCNIKWHPGKEPSWFG
tara:strand:+ start:52246 stop:52863 length:618 start_codon:yes stop_codon:yes gene_type:complete